MRLECASKPQLFARLRLSHGDEFAMQNFIYFGTKNVCEAPGHPRAKIEPERAEHHNDAAGHVFAAMLANTFDDRQRTAVTNRKAFPGAPGDVQLSGSRAIQNSVPGEHIPALRSGWARSNRNRSARKPFAHVVVGLAGQFQRYTAGEKCAKTLPGRALERLGDLVTDLLIVRAPPHQFTAQAGAHAAIRIVNGLRRI